MDAIRGFAAAECLYKKRRSPSTLLTAGFRLTTTKLCPNKQKRSLGTPDREAGAIQLRRRHQRVCRLHDSLRGMSSNSQDASLRGKIEPDEAESESRGGFTVEDENEVWRDLPRNPSGQG